MNTRKSPCEECPWRRDIRPGQFPAERYEQLRETTGERGAEAPMDAPLFGCHKSSADGPMPCAGWLAAVGYESIRVRLLASRGEIAPELLEPGEGWPPLFGSYEEMAAYQSGPEGAQSFCANPECDAYHTWQTVTPGYPCPVCKNAITHGTGR